MDLWMVSLAQFGPQASKKLSQGQTRKQIFLAWKSYFIMRALCALVENMNFMTKKMHIFCYVFLLISVASQKMAALREMKELKETSKNYVQNWHGMCKHWRHRKQPQMESQIKSKSYACTVVAMGKFTSAVL